MPQSEQELLPPLVPFKGTTVHFYQDASKPEDSRQSRRMECVYHGDPQTPVFEVKPHWHAHHDEYWTMLEGRMSVVVDGKTFEIREGDDTLCIPRCHVHGVRAIPGERARLSESSVPAGEFKEAFIRDLFQQQDPGFFLAMRAMYEGDTYPALGGPLFLDNIFITLAGGLSKLFAPGKPSEKSTSAGL